MSQICTELPAIRVEEIISNHRPVLNEAADGSDGASFESLVAGHLRQIRVLAGRLTGWDGDAEDIVQDVFAAAPPAAIGGMRYGGGMGGGGMMGYSIQGFGGRMYSPPDTQEIQ